MNALAALANHLQRVSYVVPADRLAEPLNLVTADIDRALLALEQEGFVMRGRFTDDAKDPTTPGEWCERRLLARIHRHTIKRLRSECVKVKTSLNVGSLSLLIFSSRSWFSQLRKAF